MLDKSNHPSSDARFEKILHDLKEYILWLLRKKKQIEKEKEKNPSPSSPLFPPPAPKTPDKEGKSWFDKLKDKVKETISDLSDEEGQKTHGGGA